ncbi:hypothetical protein RO3G_01840 [Rhizopus delemar RA 99-880]|uniref:Uncharacterized protein n=1 Tax=Rhizopus delemar (strain RA 99-880 / ATCC MYA-4621 / FGSC 9543 / NRRL 43880) TaxID=246409 RepID=I1BLQ6_RHIO9|nr:hypothetical protein RO3G_01840 [Rhizopus delemar RA 99-880]|eukprot:EIE77136.1 hypothetical protein RO3G_01840 [Rhizopus delemar RA 99-880]
MVPQNTSQGQKKEHAVAAVLKTRAKTTTVLGAIAPYGAHHVNTQIIELHHKILLHFSSLSYNFCITLALQILCKTPRLIGNRYKQLESVQNSSLRCIYDAQSTDSTKMMCRTS